MFTNVLFLLLALLLISAGPGQVTPWIQSEWVAFGVSFLLFLGVCALIYIQYYALKGFLRKRVHLIFILVNCELLIYLIIYQYLLDAGRIFQKIPYLPSIQSINSFWELLLYLAGLAMHYRVTFVPNFYQQKEKPDHYVLRQIRLLLPFVIPFMFITVALDIFNLFTGENQSTLALEIFASVFSLVLIILLLIFLPFFMQKIWQCQPIQKGILYEKLSKLCEKAHFKHAGMKMWTIMNDQLTAGIMGIVPRFRYIMFTQRLLNELPPESIEAILAHEIGHNKYRHLLLYPFILAGMVTCSMLFFYYFSSPLLNILEQENVAHPSIWWDLFNPVLIFFLYAAIIVFYFRIIFGYFSRLFERQADLHIFALEIPPEHMICALEKVAYTSGGYDTPNWHHYSIKQRVEYIKSCMTNPRLVQRHHRKVKIALTIYFIVLIASILLLIYLLFLKD